MNTQIIRDHKQRELAKDQQRESRARAPQGMSMEAQMVAQQTEDNRESFYEDLSDWYGNENDDDGHELQGRADKLGITDIERETKLEF